jgi:hypothetical protein
MPSSKYSFHLPMRNNISESVIAIDAKAGPQGARESPDDKCWRVRWRTPIERHLIYYNPNFTAGVAFEDSHLTLLFIGTDDLRAKTSSKSLRNIIVLRFCGG